MVDILDNDPVNLNGPKARKIIRARLAVDVDGVLCDFVNAIYQKGVELMLIEEIEVPTCMQQYEFPDIIGTLYKALLDEKSFWLNLPVHDNTLCVVPTAYVSAREIPVSWTQEWLLSNGFPAAPVYHTNGASKVDLLTDLGIQVMVEDCPSHYFQINKAGIPTYLYSQPYNINIEAEQHRIDKLSHLILQ